MAVAVNMPKLGLTMTEGTIVKWMVKVGDRVRKGDAIAEIATEKISAQVEAVDEGIVAGILAAEGETVPVGRPIAVLAGEGERPPESAGIGDAAGGSLSSPRRTEPVRASPAARRVARELGIDLSNVRPGRPDGRIEETDVRAAAGIAAASVAVPGEARERLEGMRRVIARRMKESWSTAPHVTIFMEVDVEEAERLREALNARSNLGERVSLNDLIVKAAATALREYPRVNSEITESEIIRHERVNVGVAVSLEDGLVVPVVKDADSRSLDEIAAETRRLIQRARGGSLEPDDAAGGTFTVTNLGAYGVDGFTPIINRPESAILGVGAARPRPVVIGSSVTVRRVMTLSLSFDHRLIDGALAARFLGRIKDLLERPGSLPGTA